LRGRTSAGFPDSQPTEFQMSQFLFVVDIPPPGISSEDPAAAARWFGFEATADAIQLPSQGSKKLSRNSWLFPVPGSDTILAQLMATAQKFRLSHSTFLVSGEVTPLPK
jgi:hypothetical protein